MLDRHYFVNGHLTSDAFRLLDYEEPDTAIREQMLTHLDDCPCCMDHYLEILMEEPLLEPPQGMHERIISAIQQEYSQKRGRKIILVKISKLAMAVCLTMVLFMGGVFDYLGNSPRIEKEPPRIEQQALREETSRREKRREWRNDINSGFFNLAKSLHGFAPIGDGSNERK